jgi:hypothetical protein
MKRLSIKTWAFIILSILGITGLNLFLVHRDGKLTPSRAIIAIVMSVQLLAWGWFQAHKGQLSDKLFLLWSAGMITGQLAAIAECLITRAWSVLTLQMYFLIYTLYGAFKRFQAMDKKEKETS